MTILTMVRLALQLLQLRGGAAPQAGRRRVSILQLAERGAQLSRAGQRPSAHQEALSRAVMK